MSETKKPPFQKANPPISYAEGPRLTRVVAGLSEEDQARFWKGYRAHLEAAYYASVQRQGPLICLSVLKTGSVEVFDFVSETNAQRCLSALTDCFRGQRAPIKVLMPVAPPEA